MKHNFKISNFLIEDMDALIERYNSFCMKMNLSHEEIREEMYKSYSEFVNELINVFKEYNLTSAYINKEIIKLNYQYKWKSQIKIHTFNLSDENHNYLIFLKKDVNRIRKNRYINNREHYKGVTLGEILTYIFVKTRNDMI